MSNEEKPFTTLNHPLILQHMKKVVELEAELVKQEGYDSAMILEYHLQLAGIALVAGGEYNPEIVSSLLPELVNSYVKCAMRKCRINLALLFQGITQ